MNIFDFELRKLLPVSDLLTVALPPPELKGDYLPCLSLADNATLYLGIVHIRLADVNLVAVGSQDDLFKGDRIPWVSRDFLNENTIPWCYSVLLATGLKYRMHWTFPPRIEKYL